MNTLSEPPGYPFPSRYCAVLMHAKHPVFRFQNALVMTVSRPLCRALPCPAF